MKGIAYQIFATSFFIAMVFSADDGCDVGVGTAAPASPDYGSRGNEFNGVVNAVVNGVQLSIAEDAVTDDHLVEPEKPSPSPCPAVNTLRTGSLIRAAGHSY